MPHLSLAASYFYYCIAQKDSATPFSLILAKLEHTTNLILEFCHIVQASLELANNN